jgi:CheY-like chemotaxis protein
MAKLLIVEDDILLAGMIQDFLEEESHTVEVVNTGIDGLEEIESNSFDLVILDWDLGDMSGVQILKKHRESGGTTPVIMLTAHISTDDKELGLDSGANDYLTKPFHMKELSARVRATLRNFAGRTAAPKALGSGNEELLRQGNLLGTSLAGRYEFLELIGEGGIGLVFKARHPFLQKLVAVKMLHSGTLKEAAIADFQKEAAVISRLEHPNIIAVHDFGLTENRRPFMVMELVEGKNLFEILEERDFIPLPEAVDLLRQVADGIACAHENGIIHRDIKPHNIMMKSGPGRASIPKILDFGIALLQEGGSQPAERTARQNLAVGSPPYMPPEQVLAKPVDARSDIYSFGCLIFEIVSGWPPFIADTPEELMLAHVSDQPHSLERVRPQIDYPVELKALIARCLEKDPSNRYQNMLEVKNDLEKVFGAIQARQ